VTTLTKVVREVHHVGPDGQPVDYVGVPYSGVSVLPTSTAPTNYPHTPFTNYEILANQEPYPPLDPGKSKLILLLQLNAHNGKVLILIVHKFVQLHGAEPFLRSHQLSDYSRILTFYGIPRFITMFTSLH
jgi:hypothetical protein